jgi:hypothetical protein
MVWAVQVEEEKRKMREGSLKGSTPEKSKLGTVDQRERLLSVVTSQKVAYASYHDTCDLVVECCTPYNSSTRHQRPTGRCIRKLSNGDNGAKKQARFENKNVDMKKEISLHETKDTATDSIAKQGRCKPQQSTVSGVESKRDDDQGQDEIIS